MQPYHTHPTTQKLKAAKILRGHMIDHKSAFAGTFHEGYVEYAIPSTLLQFVCMIEHGADIKSQLRFVASKYNGSAFSNCYGRYRGRDSNVQAIERPRNPMCCLYGDVCLCIN